MPVMVLRLLSLSMGCSAEEDSQQVEGEDPDRDLFLAEVDSYFALHADRLAQHNAAEGIRRFERFSAQLYASKDAWGRLEIVEPERRLVGIK